MNKEDLKQVKTIVKSEVEKLARITAKGFEKVDKLEDRVERIEVKVDKLEERVERIEVKVDRLEERVERIEVKVDRLEEKMERIEVKVDKGVERMLTIAESMASKFSNWQEENAMGAAIEARQNEQIKHHEIRITKIEEKMQRK